MLNRAFVFLVRIHVIGQIAIDDEVINIMPSSVLLSKLKEISPPFEASKAAALFFEDSMQELLHEKSFSEFVCIYILLAPYVVSARGKGIVAQLGRVCCSGLGKKGHLLTAVTEKILFRKIKSKRAFRPAR